MALLGRRCTEEINIRNGRAVKQPAAPANAGGYLYDFQISCGFTISEFTTKSTPETELTIEPA